MKIDLNSYLLSKPFIQKWYLEKGGNDPKKAVSIMSSSTHIPAIVVAFYIGEVDGWSKEIMSTIKSLNNFYDYTEILNIPESCPLKEFKKESV